MNSVYYRVLRKLKADICCKQSNLRNEQIFFLYDNSHPHFSEFIVAFLNELSSFIFPHRAYSLDLASSDFWLVARLKDFLPGQHFVNDLRMKQAVEKFFCDYPTSFYAVKIERLIDIDTKNVSILTAIMLKNRLSHLVFVVSFWQQLVHAALHFAIKVFILE